MALDILFEDEHLQVVRRRGASNFTLVTFGALTARPKPDDFWGKQVADRLDLDCIGFVAKDENWYPAASVEQARAAVEQAARPVRIGYGYSMGAYGALKHGRRLGLARSLAVAPQVSINPADLPEDQRFHQHFRPELHADMLIREADLPPWCAVLADPGDPADGLHLDRLAGMAPVVPVPTPFMGHWAIWLITGTPALDAALRRVLAADAAGLRAVLRGQRWDSAIWCKRLGGVALRHGREALAERFWQRAAALGASEQVLGQERAQALFARAKHLRAAGRVEEADAAVRQGTRLVPHTPTDLQTAGHLLLGQGEAEAAAARFRAALALDETLAAAHGGLSHALAVSGEAEGALLHAARAHALAPEDAHLAAWHGHVLLRWGDAAEAAARFEAAIRLDPRRDHAQLGLADALARNGQREAALAALRRGMEALPDHPGLRERLQRLQAEDQAEAAGPDPARRQPRPAGAPAADPTEENPVVLAGRASPSAWQAAAEVAMLAAGLLLLCGAVLLIAGGQIPMPHLLRG